MAFIALERRGPAWEIVGGDRSAAFGQTISLPDSECDGVFAGWRWEAGRLVVEADRYGFYPLYACADNGSWMLSTSIDELLARRCPRSLDYDALSVFLRVGFFVEDDTPFRAIRALPPQIRIDTAGECVEALQLHGREVADTVTGLRPITRRAWRRPAAAGEDCLRLREMDCPRGSRDRPR